jgi:hypothetical protein
MHGDLKAGNVCLVSANAAAAAAAAAAALGDAAGGGASSAAACNGTADACRHSNGSNAQGFDYVCKVRSSSNYVEACLYVLSHACMCCMGLATAAQGWDYVCKLRSSRTSATVTSETSPMWSAECLLLLLGL